MKWIIGWCERHENDVIPVDISDVPNLGITSINDVPDWDKGFFFLMSRNEIKVVLRDCTRLNLQVTENSVFKLKHILFFHQQPLMVLLLKTMFDRYKLEKIVLKDVRDLSKKITVTNPTIPATKHSDQKSDENGISSSAKKYDKLNLEQGDE